MKQTLSTKLHQWSLKRIDQKMERLRGRLEILRLKKESHKITPAQYTKRKSAIDNRLRQLTAREQTLRGAIVRERSRTARAGRTAAR